MKLVALILMVLMTISLAACGGHNLNGTWENGRHGRHLRTYEFSGRNFILREYTNCARFDIARGWTAVPREISGTFSISGDEIELVFADGSIQVRSFSRTDNTISIDNERFTRTRQ
ncbi:MAG: hypothetical protein FWB74_00875 [Defluviitaleaceae bacterium]|nr:hypothetical protein [Defluviitaleaceae bacterium]